MHRMSIYSVQMTFYSMWEIGMATGKYLSLEEARKAKKLDRFAKEHPTKGSKKAFDALLARMATKKKPAK